MNGRCKEQVWNGYTTHLCSRKDWKDGFCKQHHPDSVKKRREDADARYKAKMAAVAETQYQAKLAEDTALQDQQRWQREEIARLRLENERLREALTYDWDQLEACRESLREHMVEIKRLRELVRHILGDRITPEAYLLFGKAWVDEAHAALRREPGDG